jgi:hypothetical protein
MKFFRKLFGRPRPPQPINPPKFITIEVKESEIEQLEALAQYSKLDHRGVINNALSLWKFAVQEKRAGRTLAIYDPQEGVLNFVRIKALEEISPE